VQCAKRGTRNLRGPILLLELMIRFSFNEKKALEALVLVATEWPGITAFYASKAVFLADKHHLNKFGRPVVGDRYIAMDNGPVPSAIYDWFKGNIDRMADPQAIVDSIEFNRNAKYVSANALREPELGYLSTSDIAALREAVEFCKRLRVTELSRVTHNDPAWQQADLNSEMDPALMIEGDRRDEMVEAAEEFAAYGVA
jgi:hypothetical protein